MQKDIKLTDEDVELLNEKLGIRSLLSSRKVDLEKALNTVKYEQYLQSLQVELIKLQNWVIKNEEKVVILFEGRDAAGKGGAIRRMSDRINPRHYRIEALPKPTDVEAGQWYFQRYINRLPVPGEIVFFDRSWYNRAVVEPVNGFCTKKQYDRFMNHINEFERMLTDEGTFLIKFYFSITKEEQARRFEDIKQSPLKQWKISPVDDRAQELWDEYTKYKERMFNHTNSDHAPWKILNANKKTKARIAAIEHVLEVIPYKVDA